MGKESVVGLDAILKQLGPFGRYNIVNYALLLFPIYLAGMYSSVYVFEAPDMNYRCKVEECENTNYSLWLKYAIPEENDRLSKCERYMIKEEIFISDNCSSRIFNHTVKIPCETIIYSEEDSAVKDFDLGCYNWKRTLVGTVHNAGLFISLPMTGILSDRYGRKVALSVASLMNGIFGFLRSFSTTYYMLLIFEFLEAAMGAGAYSTAFVLAMELVGPKGRVLGNTLINVVYVLGLITLSGLSWRLQSWRNVLRVIYIPAMLVLSYLFILNESVRWLLSKGRNHEAASILKKAAKMNKVELSEELLSPLYELDKVIDPDLDKEKTIAPAAALPEDRSATLLNILVSSIILKRVCVCSFMWITCTLVYLGLSINSVLLAGNMYLNFMLVAFVEIPANFVCLLVLDKFGRKKVLIITYVLSACLCISLSFLSKDNKWMRLILFLSGKFSITVAYSSVYIYVSEVFPTNLRQSLLAICSSVGRIGSTIAPLTPLLAEYHENLPVILFGSMALTASVLVFTLPETINMQLPDTIEEAERLSKTKKKKEATA